MPRAYAVIMPVSLLLGVAAGFIMHRANFCFVCGFRNWFLFRQKFMLRMLGLVVVTSMVLFDILRHLALLPVYPFPFLGPPSVANVVGGVVFGAGMVLAGGCAIGTLYKAGSGSVISILALVGLVVGSTAYAEFHPAWKKLADSWTISPHVTIPQLMGLDPTIAVAVAVAVAAGLGFHWRKKKWHIETKVVGIIQPWHAALLLSIIGALSAFLVGMPLGVTTTYAKAGAFVEHLVAPAHVSSLEFFSGRPVSFLYAWTNETLSGGAALSFDWVVAAQAPLIIGIIAGGTISAISAGEFHPHLKVPLRQLVSGLAGGALMGLASRLTPGCNIWHLCGGLPIFALQSILFLLGLVPGAWLGTKVLVKWVIRT